MFKSILITGGNGYLGRHLIPFLEHLTSQISIVDMNILRSQHQQYNFDINNSEKLFDVFRVKKPEVVIHLAALKSISESILFPEKYFRINRDASIELANISKFFGVKRFIFASSAAVYQNSMSNPVNEFSSLNPVSPYALSKLEAEHRLINILKDSDTQLVNLRLFNLFGFSNHIPFEDKVSSGNIQSLILEAAQNNKKFKVFRADDVTPDESCIRDYVHPNDASRYISDLLIKNNVGVNTLNIGTGNPISVLELIQSFNSLFAKKIEWEWAESPLGNISSMVSDVSNLKKISRIVPEYMSPRDFVQSLNLN